MSVDNDWLLFSGIAALSLTFFPLFVFNGSQDGSAVLLTAKEK